MWINDQRWINDQHCHGVRRLDGRAHAFAQRDKEGRYCTLLALGSALASRGLAPPLHMPSGCFAPYTLQSATACLPYDRTGTSTYLLQQLGH